MKHLIHLLTCAHRLSKELQQKDKLIESLHTKLQQRNETPSSCHALSETTDQSDRTSLVSDEYQTNEDLELCSDLDSREYQEEHRDQKQQHTSGPDGIVKPGSFFLSKKYIFISLHLPFPSRSLSISPSSSSSTSSSSSWPSQVFQQLSQHAFLSHCGSD